MTVLPGPPFHLYFTSLSDYYWSPPITLEPVKTVVSHRQHCVTSSFTFCSWPVGPRGPNSWLAAWSAVAMPARILARGMEAIFSEPSEQHRTQFKISSTLFVPSVAAHHSQTETLMTCQSPYNGSGGLQCSWWMSPGPLETFLDGGQWRIRPGGHIFGSSVVFHVTLLLWIDSTLACF